MGVYYVEKVQVGDQTLEKFPLAVATDSAGISAGIFGMSPVVSGTLQYISVLQDFVLSGRIQSAAFSLDIRSWQIDGKIEGPLFRIPADSSSLIVHPDISL